MPSLLYNEYSRIFFNILLDAWNTLEYSTVSLEYSKASLDIKILKSLSLYCLIIERETYTDS